MTLIFSLGKIAKKISVLVTLSIILGACSGSAVQIIPTARPTGMPTSTATLSATPEANVMPTISPSPTGSDPTGGPSPTPLFGPTRTPDNAAATAAPALNPNAPRIEFFTTDVDAVAPGESVMLFWSSRNVTDAAIYQLNREGQRGRVWNVQPDGTLSVGTNAQERGQITFILSIGEGAERMEQTLSIQLACPIPWSFNPPPPECADSEAVETFIIEQVFERGRMTYVESSNLVYVLFNDGFEPAWITFENRYDPAIHPESEESFLPPPGYFQPIARIGYVWRGNDTVRNRLGLGINAEVPYDGFIQESTLQDGTESLYISSVADTVLQLLGDGDGWQIITLG